MEWLMANWADVLSAVLMVLGAASAVAALTPTEADDKVIQKIYSFIHALGLTKK